MKSVNGILNIVLLIAVAILFYLHFSKPGSGTPGVSAAAEGGFYFINIDTLNNKLDFLKEKQAILEKKEIDAEQKFKEKATELERAINAYQREAQGGYMTPKQMQAREQQLGRRQQALMQERDSIATVLLMESQQINDQLMKKLRKYIDEFRETADVQFIFAYSEASNILYAEKAQDITASILKKMNADKE